MQRKFIAYTLVIFIITTHVRAFSQHGHLVGKTYPERYKALDSIFLHQGLFSFDSAHAFRMLDTIKALAEDEDDDELVMEMELKKCNYYIQGKQPNKALCGPCLEKLLVRATEAGNKQLQVRINGSLSYFYRYEVSKPGLSLERQLRSYYLVREMTVAEFPNKMDILTGIGGSYYGFGDYETAKRILLEAVAAGPSYKHWYNMNLDNNLGLIYRHTGKYDSAIYFFSKAADVARTDHNFSWVGITKGNTATCYFLQGRYTEALPLLEESVRLTLETDPENAARALTLLAAIHLNSGNTSVAGTSLQQARYLLLRSSTPYEALKELYPVMARYQAQTGNTMLAYRYADSAIAAKDSFNNNRNALVMARAQQHAEAEKHLADMQTLEAQRKVQILLRNSLLIIAVLLGTVALLLINRQKIAYKRKQEKAETEKLLVESELSGAVAQLDAFTRSIQEKNELLERFTAELEQLQSPGHNTVAADQHNEILLQLQETTILTEDEWKHFKTLFEKVHGGFLNRLKQRLPDLSPAEIRFMALSKLKLTNKEMAGILGISTDAVRMNRHRLRKKLNLPVEMDIGELADSV